MEQPNKITVEMNVAKKYRVKDRVLSQAGALEWPFFFTLTRRIRSVEQTVEELTRETLLKTYAPVAVLVDQRGTIRYVHGHTGLFLEPAQGYAGVNNILKMARKKLRRDLNTTLYQAITRRSAVNSPIIEVRRIKANEALIIRVLPLLKETSAGQKEDFYLVIFEQNPMAETIASKGRGDGVEPVDQELIAINDEITFKKAALTKITVELESSHQDLDLSRNKLHTVKAHLFDAETEFQTLTEKIRQAQKELEILQDELLVSKNELDANQAVEKSIATERLPLRTELDNLKNEMFVASLALQEKEAVLKQFNSPEQPVANEFASIKQEITEPEHSVKAFVTESAPDTTTDEHSSSVTNYQPNPESFNDAPSLNATSETKMGFFSKTEPKPFFKNPGLSFGNEAGLDQVDDTKELVFKDFAEFQTAASHGYRHDSELQSVVIPEGVEIIKRSMFYQCTKLERVIIPSTLKIIEDFAFYGCESLKSINLDSARVLERIGTSAFEGCRSLIQLVIPDAVIEIEEAVFLGCQQLQSVAFMDNSQLETLGSHVFKDCVMISEMILPNQLKHIGISCFYGCDNLTAIHLPDELETLGEYAFYGCNALKKVDFSNNKLLKQPGFSVGFPDGVNL
ncbi:leucine-rich repeat protein [Acetobacterium wieringae]|uniref:leucine-rich repeat protein n=1 Tax=Acetobacterium wieringae TaxID=52694 RepID=UPI0026EADD64|nr:leucine-rich repeat protein [Acetobacterium wieringae]